MNAWRERANALAGELAATAGIDPQWAAAFADIPRHVFVPRFYHPLSFPDALELVDGTDPNHRQRWLNEVYSDKSLVTQYALTPGTPDLWQSTSSSTRPSLMARMLTLLDVHDGNRVLEIGTGTGYNSALLYHRLGSGNVASLDIDPELVDLARDRLATLGQHPTLAVGDGAAGFADDAPYDRIIATCAVQTDPRTMARPAKTRRADRGGPAWRPHLQPAGRPRQRRRYRQRTVSRRARPFHVAARPRRQSSA